MYKRFLIALLGSLILGSASAEIYKSLAPDGKVIYSNLPPAGAHAGPASRNTGTETLAPDVVGAVANVLGMAHLVNSTRDFCVASFPASLQRYSHAIVGWQQRNASVVAKKNRILAMSDRYLIGAALNSDMERATEAMMRPIKQAGAAEKSKWCDKAIEDVDRGVLDLVGRMSIAPLMNYTLR